MFGLQPTHLLLILIVALILFGPKRLPEIGRMLGRAFRDFREASNTLQKPVQEVSDTVREALTLEKPLVVFVSSVMNEECENLKPERAAAKKAAEAIKAGTEQLTRVWRFEDSPASPKTAGSVYLNKVKECDIFILVLGKEVTRPVLKEYATARRNGKPCFVFLKKCERTVVAQSFLEKIRKDVKYVEFVEVSDLDRQIQIAVATFLIKQARAFKLSANDVAVLALFLGERELQSTQLSADVVGWIRKEAEKVAGTNQKDLEKARDASRLLEINPDDGIALRDRVSSYYNLKAFDDVIHDAGRLLKINSRDTYALWYMAMAYRQLKRYDAALGEANRALEIDPNYAYVLATRAETFRQLKQYDKAIRDSTRAFEIDPQHIFAISTRALTYFDLGEYDNAVRDGKRALEIDPFDSYTSVILSDTNRVLRQYAEAIRVATVALQAHPDDPPILTVRARAYKEIGQYNDAVADLTHAIESDPKYTFAFEILAGIPKEYRSKVS